jgi:hypothetical protein
MPIPERFTFACFVGAATYGRRERMVNSSNVWRPLRVWLAVPVTLAVCLGAGSGSLRSEERRTANLAVSHQTGGLPGPIQGAGPDEGVERR